MKAAPPPDRTTALRLLGEVRLFGGLDATAFDAVAAAAEWLSVEEGETVLRAGDPPDALYVLVAGRLEAVRTVEGRERLVGVIVAGETLGELGVLLGEPRVADVRATRDSRLVRFSATVFLGLAEAHPALAVSVARALARRLSRAAGAEKPSADRVIAVVPLTTAAQALEPGRRLARALLAHGTVRRIDADDPALLRRAVDDDAVERLVYESERTHDFVLLDAAAGYTPFSRRVLAHASRVLYAARAGDGPVEAAGSVHLRPRGRRAEARVRELLLMHADDTVMPRGTGAWLAALRPDDHHHVRVGSDADWARVGRFAAGCAVGVALGGGAMRGASHLGALAALADAGVPIDAVAGTSAGAIIAAQVAAGRPIERVDADSRAAFGTFGIFDITLPVVSLCAGETLARALDGLFGDTAVEDLWLRFSAVSTNLTRAAGAVHRAGPLVRAVRASSGLPGVMPPISIDGELHVDGAKADNLPVVPVRDRGARRLIASNLIPRADEIIARGLPDQGRAVRVLAGRLLSARFSRMPAVGDIMLRATFVPAVAQAEALRSLCDLFIEPPLGAFGFFDPRRHRVLSRLGYETARREIADLKKRRPDWFRFGGEWGEQKERLL